MRKIRLQLSSLWDEAELCVRRSQELYNKIKDVTSAIESELFSTNYVHPLTMRKESETQSERLVNGAISESELPVCSSFADIRQHETSLRTELQQITQMKVDHSPAPCIKGLKSPF